MSLGTEVPNMTILRAKLDPLETGQKPGRNPEEARRNRGVTKTLILSPGNWIGIVSGKVHDMEISGKHETYLFCSCNGARIARFHECDIKPKYWRVLWGGNLEYDN